ncbi:MAG TPA: glycine--tRNA ligase [Candidatus Saccharimonadia bacterium]|nr:glycine--tRNA ligase [Candidatus Saccharimonadia bacterium]
MPAPTHPSMETLVSLSKRRGFVFQASEIYGGIAGFWDYGPYGVELAKNIKEAWWREFVNQQINVVGLDTMIIQNPKLWEASGHVATFVDPLVDCKSCKHRFRADHITDFESKDLSKYDQALGKIKCPHCSKIGQWTPVRQFNMMFQTHVGPVSDDTNIAYLRPETAGGIFAQFMNTLETSRQKIPFGIAQIGKGFRNEITPGDFIFRVREFDMMEMEYFVEPEQGLAEHKRWLDFCVAWLHQIGLKKDDLKLYEHTADERAHYAAASTDVQYNFPMGFKELYGVAYRTDFDLKAQSEGSGKDLSYFDEATKTRYTPHVVEPAIGVGRLFLALLHSAYHEEEVSGETRVVLRFKPEIAPIKVAVLPLSKKDELTGPAKTVFAELARQFRTEYDETQSIGKRYRRQDEIGTPLCVTFDFDSLEDQAVTVRHRDTMEQARVPIAELPATIAKLLQEF